MSLPCHAGGISEARAAVAQFDAEMKLAVEAHAQNDDAALQEHQKKAQEYLKQARQIYDEAGAASSDDVDVLREYGTVLMKSGDFDLAAEAFQRAAKRAPGDAALWRELGRALSLLGHPRAREAVDALRHSLAIDPSSTGADDTQATLGRVYRQEGLCDLARECFQKSLELNPDSVPAKIELVGLKIQDGEMAEAADGIDKLGALPPEHAAQLPGLLSESVQHFQASRLWFPDTAENHIAYAKILFRVGRMEEALEAAERSAKLKPDVYATWNFIGDLSLQLGREDRAREAYARSLELKADQPLTQERMDSLKK
jgi:tetratricopeptide (TPR) repeat protein